ncbi:hypothetical protein [Corynebacterium crudilactis]|uniref:Uncharacterized protein n=1 Tax=Corynebacterium crudilactis TaxID=1652495 RepID=A0A172QW18_9CORY|nr:hypothetical protein [Corynebacterium crudilactis]ANE04841.1 hypothetical protein ccrud_11975 [Corynebacterium crudilactis]
MPNLKSPRFWNIVVVILFAVLAIAQIAGIQDYNPAGLLMWISAAIIIGTVAWGLWNYKKPCSWLIPRSYAMFSVSILMHYPAAQSWTRFCLDLVRIVIFTAILHYLCSYYESDKALMKSAKTK